MPDHTAEHRQRARQTRSERELQKLGEGSSPVSRPRAVRKPPKKPAAEAVGVGRDDSQSNFKRLAAGLRKKIAVAEGAGNNTLATKLRARLVDLRKTTEGAK